MFQAPRKKKEWWETALDWVGQTADKIIPGDQSSWHSGGNNQPSTPKAAPPVQPTVRVQQPQTPLSFGQKQDNRSIFGNQAMDLLNRNQNPQGTGIQTLELPNTPRAQGQDAMRTMEIRHTGAPQVVQPFNKKAIDERLDKGYSWEKIAKETNTDLKKVKQYSQKTRPNYGIAPKKEEPKYEFYDYRMEKVGNKKLFGLDVGQFMGDYGDINKMHVDQKVSMTKDDLIKGFDYISRENAKNNTGKQTRDLYVNKLRDMAENGDERAKFTLKTLKDAGKLKGDWTDFLDSANKKFYGGLQQSAARAIEYLPGDQGTGKWADEQEKLNRSAVERGKQGEVAGQVMRTGLDIGTMITPVGMVDKAVKGTRAVQGLSNWNRGAGFVARTLPGSAVATGMDIASQDLQGNEQNIAKSAALGVGIDLALPVVGKGISKIPGVKQAGGFVMDQAGNLVRQTGNVIEAGKNNVREIRNSVDDVLDGLMKRTETPKVKLSQTPVSVKTTNPVDDLSRTAKNSLQNDITGMKPGGVERSGGFVENGTSKPIEVRTLEDGSQVIVDGRHTLEYARQNGITDYPIKDVTEMYNTPKPPVAPQKMTEREYLAQNGAHFMGGSEPALHKNRIITKRGQSDAVDKVMADMSDNAGRRAQLRAEYEQKVASGEIIAPSAIEERIRKANGHPDLQSTQAARRLLEKQGIDWKQGEITVPQAPVETPKIPSYVPEDRVDDYLKSADYQRDLEFERMASQTKSGDPFDHPDMYVNPTPEMYDNLKAPIAQPKAEGKPYILPKYNSTDVTKLGEKDLEYFSKQGYTSITDKFGNTRQIKPVQTDGVQRLDSLNPTGGVYVDYAPQARATMPLADNMTTYDKTAGKAPDELVTIYRGAPSSQKAINPGDFITTNRELAESYTGDGNVLEMQVPARDILDDATEPLGEEYIYRPATQTPIEAPQTPKVKVTNKRAIDANEHLQRLRERAANPVQQPTIAEAYGLKPETVERLVRDYGEDKARSIIQRSSDASNIRSMDAFVVSEAQKAYGKVPKKVKVTNSPIKDKTLLDDFEQMRAQAFDNPDDILGTPLEQAIIERADKVGLEVFYDEDWGGHMIALKDTGENMQKGAAKMQRLAQKYGFDLEVNKDGTIRMYHGTNQEAKEAIVNGGFNDGTVFLSPSKDVEYGGVNGAGYYGDNIVAVDVDPRKIVFNPSGEFSIDTLEAGKGGIVRVVDDTVTATDAEERLIANQVAEEQRIQDYRDRNSVLTDQQERQLAEQAIPTQTPDRTPLEYPDTPRPIRERIETDAPLGKIMETFYDSKKGNNKISYRELEAMADTTAARAYNDFQAIGSDLRKVAQITQEQVDAGNKLVDNMPLTPQEKQLWKAVQAEQDYMRRRSSLGNKEIGGDQGDSYWHRVSPDNQPTRETLLQGYLDKKPGSEMKRRSDEFALKADEISYSPKVISKYIIEHGDTKLLQEERIYRALQRDYPGLPEEQIRKAAQQEIEIQTAVNNQKVKIGAAGLGKKVTVTNGKVIDLVDEFNKVGETLAIPKTEVVGTPRGLTNGARINSVSVNVGGKLETVADLLGMNQLRDSTAYAYTQVARAGGDRELLANAVENRLRTAYNNLPQEEIDYALESIRRIKPGVDDKVVAGRVEGIYRNTAKNQMVKSLHSLQIQDKTLKKDVSDLAKQILREGTTEKELSAAIVQKTLRAQNALFRKLNVSSALNELSDLTSFYNIYGKNTKIFTPDFKLVKELGLGEIDPAIEPYLKQIDEGVPVNKVLTSLKKLNEGTRFYKFVETYKAGVLAKTAKEFYSNPANGGLVGDELTARILQDYRDFALPVDMFTKTFLDDYPLYTQYMTWGARNLEKEGKMLTGQFDAGVLKNMSKKERFARDLYANIPAKTAFWLASNGLKGTAIMTAFGLTDFTGLTNQDYSGIAEEDKSWFDRTTQWTNMSTTLSLLNTTIQALEKEHLKQKYADKDYNPYENANFGESLINTYTPQFLKNALGANDLQQRGYSDNNNSVADQVSRLFGGKPEEGRVQYEAPEDAWNIFKSFVFGKNQTANAREYSGRENLVDRMVEGKDPFTAVKDMAAEQLGIKDTDYNRPLTDDYSEAYKAAEDGARTALLQGGRQYNDYLDNLKKEQPDLYNNYIQAMDGNHVSPEYWRNISQSKGGGANLDTFKMIGDRKKQLKKDLGVDYDPIYDLPDDQAAAVLRLKSAPTGDDLSIRMTLNKEQWYKDLKDRQKAFYKANPIKDTDSQYTSTERVKEWDRLDDELNSFFYNSERIKEEGEPAWAKDYPLVYQQKAINDQYGFGSEESSNFFRNNADAYYAQKEAYDKAQLAIINQMRKIEGYPEMSWEAYQQATEIADTDGDSGSKSGWKNYSRSGGRRSSGGSRSSGGGSSISPNADVTYNSAGTLKINKPTVKVPTVKIKRKGDVKKITLKRSKRG